MPEDFCLHVDFPHVALSNYFDVLHVSLVPYLPLMTETQMSLDLEGAQPELSDHVEIAINSESDSSDDEEAQSQTAAEDPHQRNRRLTRERARRYRKKHERTKPLRTKLSHEQRKENNRISQREARERERRW